MKKEKTWIVYCHTNKINGKKYIGLTCQSLNARWKNGLGYDMKHQRVFALAIRKWGWKNFNHEILAENIKTLAEAKKLEQYWIAKYHTYIYDPECNGHNMTRGGDIKRCCQGKRNTAGGYQWEYIDNTK